MACLSDVQPVPDEEAGEGAVKIQLDFHRLPEEIMPQLRRLLAAPGDIKHFRYVKDGSARTGVEIPVKPSDLEGNAYDYAN